MNLAEQGIYPSRRNVSLHLPFYGTDDRNAWRAAIKDLKEQKKIA